MITTAKTFLAVSAIAIYATSAFADREELNSGFHGNTSYQTSAPQRLSPTAVRWNGQTPARRTNQFAIRGRAANAYGQLSADSLYTPSIKVYEWGRYQGQDPDSNVRLQLRRDVHN